MGLRGIALSLALGLAACMAEPSGPVVYVEPPFSLEPGRPVLRRLTAAQYTNAVHDLLGDVTVAGPLEPDAPIGGLVALGAAETTISAWGVEQYEQAAWDLAQQALGDPARRERLVPCSPEAPIDLDCAARFVEHAGRLAWRRPLDAEEVAGLTAISTTAAGLLGDFHQGLEAGLATMLQSPRFLFRVEVGEPDPDRPGERRYEAFELASRLSFFLWDSAPDDELLDAAARGELHDDEALARQVERMLAAPSARRALRTFFADLLDLAALDRLTKDPTVFPHYSSDLGPAAREETLRVIEHLVFDLGGDYRDLLTFERSFVDRRLAAIYGVPATVREGFGEVLLRKEDGRRGLLGHASILALQAHAVSSSATRRGKFVRQVLLCGQIPPPPVDVNAALPEPSGTARTLRERVKEHLVNPGCAGCHLMMDPIGLGLEAFDGIGRRRMTDNGATIDPSSELDGAHHPDAWSLAQGLRDHPALPACLVRNAWRYANGRVEAEGEVEQLAALGQRFATDRHDVRRLWLAIATSRGFRRVAEVEP